ncbi:unnamed protein product [Durusdinium trenchii]|uniref:Uncharacterized protein n=1 Tax=Durusdinium trenchii TaxID=1381693 RepID=A0ABP0LWS5_9DINO
MEWDAASSVNTVGSYVHTMFGHAKAREIASEDGLVMRTNKYGKRLLTMQSRVTNKMTNDHRNALQYGWIKYRVVGYTELEPYLRKHDIDNKYVKELQTFLQSQNLVHCIVTNIHDESWVITNYFWEEVYGMDVKDTLQSTILDFLEADDPGVIADAASDPIFRKALMQHFSGGDSKEQRNWHTLSKLKAPWNLLNLCCQNNYSECADLLLSEHTPETAKQPWLTFAEPLLSIDKYASTAFHTAAWNGSAESLEHLVAFASKYSIPVDKLLDVKKKTCLQIARERGNHRCVEILAPLFGFKVEQGLRDGARNEQEAILFLDFEKLHEMRDIDLQSIPLAPPQELLRWIQFDGMSWLISEDVASRTYAEDDVWITVAKGDEVVKVESMMRDCVWDVTMETQSLPTRVRTCGFSYLRIFVAARRRVPVPKEGSAGILLDSLRKVLARVPPGRQVSQVTLLGFTLVPSEKEHTVFDDIFDTLLQCSTISFRKCSCQASTLLHLLQAIRRALCHKAYSWIGLWVMPSCPARSESPELAAAFRVEMPRFLYALRKSKLCHISRSGCKTCRIPAGPLEEADRFWLGVVDSQIPAFFLHGVLYIWRYLYKPANVLQVEGTNMEEALSPSAEVYVQEWLKNVAIPLRPSSGNGLDELRDRLGLVESEMDELLKHLDYAIWALLRMHRLLPFAPQAVREIVPRPVLQDLPQTQTYWREHDWDPL